MLEEGQTLQLLNNLSLTTWMRWLMDEAEEAEK